MNCADAEILICDYATLSSAERFELERHLGECRACTELARDSAAASRSWSAPPMWSRRRRW